MARRISERRREVADRLHSAAIHLLRRVRRTDQRTGLSPARLSALSVLVFGGECSLSELAEAEQVTLPTMTRLVQGLEADGLAVRRRNPDDGRGIRIRASARGKRILENARQARIENLAALLGDVSGKRILVLEKAVETMEALFPPE